MTEFLRFHTYGGKKLSSIIASRTDQFKAQKSKRENGATVIEAKLAG